MSGDAYDLRHTFEWPPSSDPNDEAFGDVVSRTTPGDVDAFDAVLVGEPYDGAVLGRSGARTGPRALRRALARTKTHHFDAGPVRSVADLGDVAVPGRNDGDYPRNVRAVQERIGRTVAPVHGVDVFPVFLGGDNSLTYANAGSLLEAAGDGETVGAVNFDAHLDCRALDDGPSSGTPYRQLLEAGLDDLAVVGARHFETSTGYHDYLRAEGGEVVTAEECTEPVEAVDRALDSLGDVDHVYASVDLDVLDAAAAPGVSAPTPGGITARELFVMCRVLAADPRLAGFEVVECAPRHDSGDRTARAGARAIAHVLAARSAAGLGSGPDGAGSGANGGSSDTDGAGSGADGGDSGSDPSGGEGT